MKVAIYCRVSRTDQILENQINPLVDYCKRMNYEYEIFTEKLAEHYGLKESKIKEVFDDVEDDIIVLFRSIDKKVKAVFETWFGEI